ncbi:MAG: hypothetical protein K9L30_07130 [Desulfobacterales bacterium]|nr:hypothetical protein [Desulfobacterales bacterium]
MSETKQPTYGNFLGFAFFHWVLRLLGLIPAYLILMAVIPYYVIFRPSVFRSSDHYLRHRFPDRHTAMRHLISLRYIYGFGCIIIEQVALGILGHDRMKVSFPDRETLYHLSGKKTGIVLLTTHVGPWQSVMATIDKMACRVFFHFDIENWQGGHFFDLASQRDRFSFISPRGHLGGMIEATKVLMDGDCLSIMGDRVDTAHTIKTSFLGEDALFPVLPYHLATSTGADIVALLTARTGPMEYKIEYKCLTEGLTGDNYTKEELQSILAGRYADFLEQFLKKYPLMWYNFFNFWEKNKSTLKN